MSEAAGDLRDAGRGERLQKVLARCGVGSRRSCEGMIEEGRVEVNGEVVRGLPAWVDPERDRIEVDGRVLRGVGRSVYVMLYKPRRTVTTAEDEAGRRTVVDLVDHPSGARLFPVGRLDYDTMGLLLMTNDGELANLLTHPRYGVEKTYRAVVRGALTEERVAELERGIYLASRRGGQTVGAERTGDVRLRLVRTDAARTILDVTLKEGKNRQVRRMLARVDCPVRKLVRIRMGPLSLKGLRLGAWRELTAGEVRALRRAARRARRTSGKGGGG